MKRLTIIILLVISVFFTVSCVSKSATEAQSELIKWRIPDYLFNLSKVTNVIYGVGNAKQSTVALSMKVAHTNAIEDIFSQIEITIQEATTSYAQEAGVDYNTKLINFIETITRQITDETFSNITVQSRDIMEDGCVWVLVVLKKEKFLNYSKEIALEYEKNEDTFFKGFEVNLFLKRLEYHLNKSYSCWTDTSSWYHWWI